MLETLFQLAIKGIPESLLSVLMIYFISQTKFEKKKYYLITLLYFVATYFIRMLPVVSGVNTILGFSLLSILMIALSGAKPQKTFFATLLTVLVIIVCEFLNLLFVLLLYGEEMANALANGDASVGPIKQTLITIPSTVFFGIFVLAAFYVMKFIAKRKNEKQLKKDTNGTVSQ